MVLEEAESRVGLGVAIDKELYRYTQNNAIFS